MRLTELLKIIENLIADLQETLFFDPLQKTARSKPVVVETNADAFPAHGVRGHFVPEPALK